MHLAHTFTQSDLQQAFMLYIFVSVCVERLGFEPTIIALLTQYSTTEPQEHGDNPWFWPLV